MNINIPLALKLIEWYNDNPEFMKDFFVNLTVPKNIMLDTYKSLVRQNELIPIEDLPIEEKTKLWEQGNKNADLCRILHFINQTCK